MKAFASSLSAWKHLERQEGVQVPHGLVFPLAVIEAIGAPHGLELTAEEHVDTGRPDGFDAVFISVLDARCMVETGEHFTRWGLPLRAADRTPDMPLVWAGGSGLHNPAPYGAIADLIVVGDAEAPLPILLDLWATHGNGTRFLSAAAAVPGVWVPSVHDPGTPIIQQVADDIAITLRHNISVNHDGRRRIEIARGCRFSCDFCSLGWRTPYRENTTEAIVGEIRRSPKLVHLQAGDAESHSGIDDIRTQLAESGGYDSGWTGRLDSLLDNPDTTISGQKRYAFGVEGVSERLRRSVGKGYLTDERLASDTVTFLARVQEDHAGRAAWHVIAGLPGQRPMESLQLGDVVRSIAKRLPRSTTRRNLSLHWQPFSPLPGTPMQWAAAGSGARQCASTLDRLKTLDRLNVKHVVGRTDAMSKMCAVIGRSDARAVRFFERSAPMTPDQAASATGSTYGPLDPDDPLPWDFVVTHHDRGFLVDRWRKRQAFLNQQVARR